MSEGIHASHREELSSMGYACLTGGAAMRTGYLLTRACFGSAVIGCLLVASCSSGTDVTEGGDGGASGDAGPSADDGGGASSDGSTADGSPQDAGGTDASDAGDALPSPLDPMFGVSGLVTTAMRDSNEDIYDLLRTPDGKAIVVGRSFGNDRAFAARFTATGAVDTTFGTGGKVLLEPAITLPPLATVPDGVSSSWKWRFEVSTSGECSVRPLIQSWPAASNAIPFGKGLPALALT